MGLFKQRNCKMENGTEIASRIERAYKGLWLWSIIGAIVMLIAFGTGFICFGIDLQSVIPVEKNSPQAIAFLVVFIVAVIACLALSILAFVSLVRFLYNVWKTVAKPTDKIGAGWRVFWLFVPLVALITSFFFYWEFAKRANEKLAILNKPKQVGETSILCFCILNVISAFFNENFLPKENPVLLIILSVIFFVLAIISLVLLVRWIIQAKRAAITLANNS